MTHYLVVAHKTLIGEHLLAEAQKRMDQGPSEFHLVVPVTHPVGSWSQGSVDATARERALRISRGWIRGDGRQQVPVRAAGVEQDA